MKRLALVSTALGIAAAGSLTAAGQASATNTHPRTETFTIMSVSDPSTSTVIAAGRFSAGGADNSGSTADRLTFPNGKLTLKHHGKRKTRMNARTCTIITTGSGTLRVAHGTGAYRGMKGSGHYVFSVHVVLARAKNGTCDPNATPAAFEYLVKGHARITS